MLLQIVPAILMIRLQHISLLLGLSLATSCEVNIVYPIEDDPFRVSSVGQALHKRAEQIAEIQWTPSREMPTQGGFYQEGKTIKGIPYSSVKEMEKFVGQYVSFYTFMTAVSNPKSVLYTENVKEPPYHGTNCSTFYGTVCSMAVNYVLGLPYSYTTSTYKNLPCFEMVNPQSIDAALPGDILLQDKKHVVLILDVFKRDERVSGISILESYGGGGTHIYRYTRESIAARWQRDGWELLRYKDLDKITEIESMAFNDYPYNTPYTSPICCSRGDRASFAAGETIVLNNLDDEHHQMRIVHDGAEEGTIVSAGSDVTFSTLSPGIYTFDLSNPAWNNPSVEVIDATVSAQRSGDELVVSFLNVNAKPMSMIISNIHGNHYVVEPIDDSERGAGRKVLKMPNRSGQLYLKVMFEGAYGSVSNEPLLIQQ